MFESQQLRQLDAAIVTRKQCQTWREIGPHSVNDLATRQLTSTCHHTAAHLHHISGLCSPDSIAYGLETRTSSSANVPCYAPRVRQLAVCRIDDTSAGMFGDVLLECLQSRVLHFRLSSAPHVQLSPQRAVQRGCTQFA